jgi:hypothetical protein
MGATMKKIELGVGSRESYFVTPIFKALQLISEVYNFEVSLTPAIPAFSIRVDGQIIGFVAHSDYYPLGPYIKEWLAPTDKQIKIIFKYQFDPLWDYGKEIDRPERVVSAGYIFPWFEDFDVYNTDPVKVLNRERPIDVVAGMTLSRNAATYSKVLPVIPLLTWSVPRQEIIQESVLLRQQGYRVETDMVPRNIYFNNLFSSKLGFNWSGCGYLTFRILEYICAGVVMITNPLGEDHPIREDVILEDGVHCIFCDNPKQFNHEAVLLLKDPDKMRRIRANVISLWNEKLCLKKMGEFYYQKLKSLEEQ